MKPATPDAQLTAAKAIARRNGLFISVKDGKYHVYRAMAPRNIHLGFRRTPADLFDYIEHLTRAEVHP